MKAILMGCKTAGFQHGDTAEVGTGKGKISVEDAKALVDKGLATEVKVVIAGKSNEVALETANKTLAETLVALEAKNVELETANKTLAETLVALEAKNVELETAKAKK